MFFKQKILDFNYGLIIRFLFHNTLKHKLAAMVNVKSVICGVLLDLRLQKCSIIDVRLSVRYVTSTESISILLQFRPRVILITNSVYNCAALIISDAEAFIRLKSLNLTTSACCFKGWILILIDFVVSLRLIYDVCQSWCSHLLQFEMCSLFFHVFCACRVFVYTVVYTL